MSTQTSPISGSYAADPIHSSFGFAVKYMGVSTFRGTLDKVTAKLDARRGGSDRRRRGGVDLDPHARAVPRTRVARSTVSLPDDAQPGDVLFNSTGTNLVGTRVGSSLIDSFSVGRNGRLTAAPGSPFLAQGAGPFGSEFRPTDPSQLFVSNAHDGAGDGTVSAFNIAADGSLSSIGSSPFADLQTAPCWVEITHDGEFLFTVNTASGSISRYSIAADGSLTLLGSTQVSSQSGVGAVDARLSGDGQRCTSTRAGSRPSASSTSTAVS